MSTFETQKINVVVATIIGMNAMIGAGIVSMPAILANTAGPIGIFAYMISVFVVLMLGFSLARLAHLHPGKGWTYFYPSLWGGHFFGMVSAWSYLVGVIIAMGFLVQQAGVWLYSFYPVFTPSSLGVGLLLILTALVLGGAQVSSVGQYIIATCVLVPLLLTSTICWFNFEPSTLNNLMPYGPRAILSATSLTLFSFLGFESISSLYSSLENPQKNVARATVYSIIAVGGLYSFFAGGVLFSIPLHYFSKGLDDTIASVLQRAFPQYFFLSLCVLIGGLFAIIGTLHSMIWSLSVLFSDVVSRARSHFIMNLVKENIWNNKVAVIATSSSMLVSALVMRGEDLVNMSVFLIIISYILSIMLLLFEKEEWKSGRNIVTLCALAGALVMLYMASLPLANFIIRLSS